MRPNLVFQLRQEASAVASVVAHAAALEALEAVFLVVVEVAAAAVKFMFPTFVSSSVIVIGLRLCVDIDPLI